MLVLSIERSVWVNAGMHEEAHSIVVEGGQRTKPFNVLSRELDRAWDAVAVQGRGPTISQPIGLVRFVFDGG